MAAKPSKALQLEMLKKDILDSKICPELEAGATQLVFGDGNPDSEVVFIGEAPGKKEDEIGLPFVGAAGKFLEEMLATLNLSRKDVYITNIVKYRPPNNRDPLPDEKTAFLPYLKRQLMVINPKLIVTLGRHSMEALLPGLRISQCHGQPKRIQLRSTNQKIKSWVILPLFHPAAALYNGAMRQTLMDDFLKIPAILAKI